MKFYQRFWIDEKNTSPELYQKIVEVRPDCRYKDNFHIESQPGDQVNAALIKQLIDLCEQHSVPRTKAGELGTYDHQILRHYEDHDLEVARLLILQTQKRMFRERLKRDDSGRLLLPARQSGTSIQIASGMFDNVYVTSDSVRNVLEAGQLAGLFFRETVQKGTSVRATTEALWEVDTNIKLPKMTNSVLNAHSVVPCYAIDERPYRAGEPHYLQHDLLPVGEFDIARTFEPLPGGPGLIVSQRFYQHCLTNKIPLDARPVRIEQD